MKERIREARKKENKAYRNDFIAYHKENNTLLWRIIKFFSKKKK